MVIDDLFPRCCESCIHGDSNTTWCYKKNSYMPIDQYRNGVDCEGYESIHETINKAGCPCCGGHDVIFDDSDDGDSASIECNICGWAMYGNTRHDVIHDWMSRA